MMLLMLFYLYKYIPYVPPAASRPCHMADRNDSVRLLNDEAYHPFMVTGIDQSDRRNAHSQIRQLLSKSSSSMLRAGDSLRRQLAASDKKIPLTFSNVTGRGYMASVKLGQDTVSMSIDILSDKLMVKCGDLAHSTTTCLTTCPVDAPRVFQIDTRYCYTETKQDYLIGDVEVIDASTMVLHQESTQEYSPENQLGLAPIDVKGGGTTTSIFKSINSFSLSLAHNDPFLLFDGVDQTFIENEGFKGLKVQADEATGWYMPLTAIQFGNTTAQFPCQFQDYYKCIAGLSPFHNYVSMDSEVYNDFKAQYLDSVGCVSEWQTSSLCDASAKFPRITVGSDDNAFYIESEDYVQPSKTPGKVSVLVGASLGTNAWGLGLPFLKKYYTHFDNAKKQMTLYCHEGKTCDTGVLPRLINLPSTTDTTASYDSDSTNPPHHTPSDTDSTGPDMNVGIVTTSSRSGRKTGLYVGIGCGIAAFFAIIAVVKFFIGKKKSPQSEEEKVAVEDSKTAYTVAATPNGVEIQP